MHVCTYVCPKKCTVHTFIVLTRASSSSCRFSFGCMTSLNAALSLSIRCLIHITQAAGPDRVHHQSHIPQCTSPYSLVHLWPFEGLFHVLVQHSAVLGVPPLQYCAQNIHLQHTHMTQSLSLMGASQHNVRMCVLWTVYILDHAYILYIRTYARIYICTYVYMVMYVHTEQKNMQRLYKIHNCDEQTVDVRTYIRTRTRAWKARLPSLSVLCSTMSNVASKVSFGN